MSISFYYETDVTPENVEQLLLLRLEAVRNVIQHCGAMSPFTGMAIATLQEQYNRSRAALEGRPGTDSPRGEFG